MRCPRGSAAHRSAPLRGEGGREGWGGGAAARGHIFASFHSPLRVFPFGCPAPPLVLAAGRFGGARAGFAPAPVAGRTYCPRCGAGCAASGGAVRECRRQGIAPVGPCPSAALPSFLLSAERSIPRGRSACALGRGGARKVPGGARRGRLRGRGGAALRCASRSAAGGASLLSAAGADGALKPLFGAWGQS